MKRIWLIYLLLFSQPLFAQEEDVTSNDADSLYQKEVSTQPTQSDIVKSDDEFEETKSDKLKSITQLETLAPFDDLAVIQRKYLPKSQRFEFHPNLGMVTNNAFFINGLAQMRLGYAFTEKWAVESMFSYFFDSKAQVTEDLKDKNSVNTQSLILPEMYYGLDIRWTPVYGKMGVFEGVKPFDMYFSLGGGITDTNQDTTPFTIHAGTGQIFAISKSTAFRWDLSMYRYTSKTQIARTGSTETKEDTFTDIELTIGMSFFFPEASYR